MFCDVSQESLRSLNEKFEVIVIKNDLGDV